MHVRGSRPGDSRQGPDVSRGGVALGTLILLAAFIAAPVVAANETGCSIRIGVVDGTGAPAAAGVVVRVAAGDRAVERDWPGGTEAIELDAAPCGPVVVEAGYRQGWAPHDRVSPFTSVESVLVPGVPGATVLEVPALRSVRVRVRDRDDWPVPGVVASLLPRSGFEERLGESVTRNTGHDGTFTAAVDVREAYEIRTPRSWADRGVTATLDGRPVEIPVMLAPGLRAAEVDYVVPSGHRVRVSVRDLSGRGVPAVGFKATGEMNGTYAPTAADGSSAVTVEALPVEVQPLDLADAGWVFEPETVMVTAENGHETFAFLAREREGDTFVLRVTEARTGNPVAGARLEGGTKGDCPEHVPAAGRTDDDGVSQVPCSPCPYWIWIDPPPGSVLLRETWQGEILCDEGLSVELESGAVLTGSVRDLRGRPVAGLPLTVGRGRGTGHNATTDEEGRFELRGIATGIWYLDLLRARSPDRSRGMVLVRADARADSVERLEPSVTIDSPDEKPEIELQLVPGGLACVRLSDPDGNPVPVRSVEAFLADGEEALSRNRQSTLVGHDDPERLCTLPLAPGRYLLRAGEDRFMKVAYVPVWWPGEEDRALATAVEVEPGKTVELGPMIITLAGALLLEVPGVERPELEQLRVELRRYPEGTDAAAGGQAEADDTRPWTTVEPHRVDFGRRKPEDPDPPPLRVSVRTVPVGAWDARVCVLPETDDEDAGASEASSTPCWSLREPVEVRPNETVEAELTPVPAASGSADHPACGPSAEVREVLAAHPSSQNAEEQRATIERMRPLVEASFDPHLHRPWQSLFPREDWPKLIETYDAWILRHPEDADLLYDRGRLLALAGDRAAEAALEAALALDPEYPWAHFALIHVFRTTAPDAGRAREHLERFVAACPSLPLPIHQLRGSASDPASFARAAEDVDRALRANLERVPVGHWPLLWNTLFELGHPNSHGEFRRRIAENLARLRTLDRPDDRGWLEALGDGYAMVGDEEGTAWVDRTLLAHFPGDPATTERIVVRWLDRHPAPLAGEREAREAWLTALEEVTATWVERWPAHTLVRKLRFDALAELPGTSPEAVLASGERLRDAVAADASFSSFPPVGFDIAAAYLDRSVGLTSVPALIDDGFAQIGDADRASRWIGTFLRIRALAAQGRTEEARAAVVELAATLEELDARELLGGARSNLCAARAAVALAAGSAPDARAYANAGLLWNAYGLVRRSLERTLSATAAAAGPGDEAARFLRAERELYGRSIARWEEAWDTDPRPLPSIEAWDLDGKRWTNDELRGRTTIVVVWATWCGPCARELPEVQALHERARGADDLAVVTINVDENRGLVQPFVDAYGFTFPVLLGSANAPELAADGLPATWIVAPDGTIVRARVGWIEEPGWPDRVLALARRTGAAPDRGP